MKLLRFGAKDGTVQMDDERKIILEAMVGEASRLGDAIAERHAAAERFIAIAGTLSGVGLTLGLVHDQEPILIGLPIGLAIIILYMLQIYTDAGMHSGHREALELRLKAELGQTVLIGQKNVAKQHDRRPSVRLTSCLTGLVWIGTVVLGGITVCTWSPTSGTSDGVYIWIYFLLVAFTIYVMFRAVGENSRAERSAIAAAESAWSMQGQQ